jgi:hypothetical protein
MTIKEPWDALCLPRLLPFMIILCFISHSRRLVCYLLFVANLWMGILSLLHFWSLVNFYSWVLGHFCDGGARLHYKVWQDTTSLNLTKGYCSRCCLCKKNVIVLNSVTPFFLHSVKLVFVFATKM